MKHYIIYLVVLTVQYEIALLGIDVHNTGGKCDSHIA